MVLDTEDWAIEGIVRNHRIIFKMWEGSNTSSYLAEDEKGRRLVMTYLDTGRMMERYRFKLYSEGADIKDVDAKAQEMVMRWQDEFREAMKRIKGLGSDHVAVTYDLGADQEKNQLVVLSEHIPGVDFHHASYGLKPMQMISLFVQALEGLKFIHGKGFLHLNVKPSRIRVNIEARPPVVKFSDFGFAIPISGYEGDYHGTAIYMAPEVAESRRGEIGERSDLYSFGVMAYYCLTNYLPTEHRLEAGRDRKFLVELIGREGVFSPPSHLNGEVPPQLDRIVLQLLEREPAKRVYGSAHDLISEICQCWPEESVKMPHEETSTLIP